MRALSFALMSLIPLAVAACEPTEETQADPPAETPADEAPTVATRPYALVSTGQTGCYTTAGQVDCAAAALVGQDAQWRGAAADYTLPGDGTVIDAVTGLQWTEAHLGQMSWTDAWDAAAAARVGGYDDWRLPSLKELYSLMNFDGATGQSAADSIPYLDDGVFDFEYGDEAAGERFIDAQYWSATEYVGTTMNGDHTVFGVNFADGRIKGYPTAPPQGGEAHHFVRLVRGNPAYGVNQLIDGDDGTVTDAATGLQWMQADAGQGMDWAAALAWCEGLDLAGHSDWRLPDAKSLQSIVDYGRSPTTTDSAAIDPVFSVSDPQLYFWTSTTHRDGPRSTWGQWAAYVTFGQAFGYMQGPGGGEAALLDVHGAGAQRSDPKAGDPADWAGGHGPQGDDVRILNAVRCVRGGATFEAAPEGSACGMDCVGGAEGDLPDGGLGGDGPPTDPPTDEPPTDEPPTDGPPAEAIAACEGQQAGAACQIVTPMGQPIEGTCQAVPQGTLACVPAGGPPTP